MTEIAQEIEELKAEWHEFKSRALWLLVGGLIAMVGYGSWVGIIQSEITYNKERINASDNKHYQIESRLGAVELNNGEIKAKLSSIETSLQEIKLGIKQLR